MKGEWDVQKGEQRKDIGELGEGKEFGSLSQCEGKTWEGLHRGVSDLICVLELPFGFVKTGLHKRQKQGHELEAGCCTTPVAKAVTCPRQREKFRRMENTIVNKVSSICQ